MCAESRSKEIEVWEVDVVSELRIAGCVVCSVVVLAPLLFAVQKNPNVEVRQFSRFVGSAGARPPQEPRIWLL